MTCKHPFSGPDLASVMEIGYWGKGDGKVGSHGFSRYASHAIYNFEIWGSPQQRHHQPCTPMSLLSSIRSFSLKRPYIFQCRRYLHEKQCDPLRILFCGSDNFSAASLEALDDDRRSNASSIIKSIDVVCRPGKRTGRGLKTIRNGMVVLVLCAAHRR